MICTWLKLTAVLLGCCGALYADIDYSPTKPFRSFTFYTPNTVVLQIFTKCYLCYANPAIAHSYTGGQSVHGITYL
uniref:Putative secreted protein n=1 Tax=Anopheles triannulatus TaxID=58253 RepID=A0A2M4B343_9DIPT